MGINIVLLPLFYYDHRLCTDGLANVGLGSLEDIDTNEDKEQQACAFYTRIGQYALDKGVTINVVGIEGCGCDVEHLGVMSDITEGDIEKVLPMDLAKNFATALANPVVACKAQVAMFLHRGLMFRATDEVIEENGTTGNGNTTPQGTQGTEGTEGTEEETSNAKTTASTTSTTTSTTMSTTTSTTRVVRDIGNVTEETDTSFEFNARPVQELVRMGCENIKELPFQGKCDLTILLQLKDLRELLLTFSTPLNNNHYNHYNQLLQPPFTNNYHNQLLQPTITHNYYKQIFKSKLLTTSSMDLFLCVLLQMSNKQQKKLRLRINMRIMV